MSQEFELDNITIEADISGDTETLKTLDGVRDRYEEELADKMREHFHAVFLTGENKILGDREINVGASNYTVVDLADIIRTAALVNATAVIIAHNHPSGDHTPTEKDINVTEKLYNLLDLVDVTLLDHVIISRNGAYSMKHEQPEIFEINEGDNNDE